MPASRLLDATLRLSRWLCNYVYNMGFTATRLTTGAEISLDIQNTKTWKVDHVISYLDG
jgi:hypothetical protein